MTIQKELLHVVVLKVLVFYYVSRSFSLFDVIRCYIKHAYCYERFVMLNSKSKHMKIECMFC